MDLFEFDPPTTTAIYPNRLEDKKKVEAIYSLQEHGNDATEFYDNKGKLFAIGYERVVYGDHGPYVEFRKGHIISKLQPKWDADCPDDSYYELLVSVNDPFIEVYDQKRDVKKLKNPPKGGFRGNRSEGYADYKPGMFYVGVFKFCSILNYE